MYGIRKQESGKKAGEDRNKRPACGGGDPKMQASPREQGPLFFFFLFFSSFFPCPICPSAPPPTPLRETFRMYRVVVDSRLDPVAARRCV